MIISLTGSSTLCTTEEKQKKKIRHNVLKTLSVLVLHKGIISEKKKSKEGKVSFSCYAGLICLILACITSQAT